MGASIGQIFSFLTEPEGSLIYHLILVFSIAGALQSAFVHWRSSEFPQARRTMFGLGMLLIAQIGLFLVSALGDTRHHQSAALSAPAGPGRYTFFTGMDDLAVGIS